MDGIKEIWTSDSIIEYTQQLRFNRQRKLLNHTYNKNRIKKHIHKRETHNYVLLNTWSSEIETKKKDDKLMDNDNHD